MPSPLSDDVAAIFCEAIELRSADARAVYLASACGGDDALRRQVELLVAAHLRAGDFLDRPPGDPAEPTAAWAGPEAPGTVVGPYTLLEVIGRGGMGVVYVADQAAPVRRRVAVKLIRPGMDTQEVVARFEAERQALAVMDHPHIAKVFDAGATAAGRPYFVMELVRGLPITDYCDRAGLAPPARLKLFALVCRAVQHAHQKGVIHRDLKPSNVLVAEHDGVAVPKVIDFGVAKAVGPPLTNGPAYTRLAEVVGTPLYMAPEQAGPNSQDVDTRADVYALGVLLYELLTGTTPFDCEAVGRAALDEVRRMLREDDPPRPSTRVSGLGDGERSGVAVRRGVDDRRLVRLLRGDLDWVAMKALEKDRGRRYESAGAFAADIERHLADEPVEARPVSAWYRARKAARRNRPLLVTAGLVAAALVAGTAVSVWQAIRATEAQQRAETAEQRAATDAAIAREVNTFLQVDLLGQAAGARPADHEIGDEPYLTVKEALDRASARIGLRFRDQPLVEAAVRTAIGEAYNRLYAHQLAVFQLERAVALRTDHLGAGHPDTQASMTCLAGAWGRVGRFQDAIDLRRQIVESRQAQLGPDNPAALACGVYLADAYRVAGQWESSTPLLEHLFEKHIAVFGPAHLETLGVMESLASQYEHLNRFDESMAMFEKLLNQLKSRFGSGHPSINHPTLTFARVCQRAGKLDQADRLIRNVIEQQRKLDDAPGRRADKANALGWLALNLQLQGQPDRANPLVREAVAAFEKVRPEYPRRFYWESLLGDVLRAKKQYPEAETHLLRGYQGMKEREKVMLAFERRQLSEACERVVHFYKETGQTEKACEWQAKLSSAARPK